MNIPIKILFLSANPKDTSHLRLDEEIRSIDQALHQAEFRDKFDIEQHWAVRTSDLQSCLLRHKPDIVHFSGHGSLSSEIILEDNEGNSQPVSNSALSQLFSILKDNIRCVVLNACFSEQQARAIAEHIDCVVGMSKAIGDPAAITFATAFYQAIGYGRDVKTAFDLGCVQLDLEKLNEQDTPKLLAINSNPKKIVFVNQSQILKNRAQISVLPVTEIPELVVKTKNRKQIQYTGLYKIIRLVSGAAFIGMIMALIVIYSLRPLNKGAVALILVMSFAFSILIINLIKLILGRKNTK